MSKRKREDDAPATSNDFRQQRRIVATFTQSAEKLAQAFKTARGFERQKLGRRKKNAVKEQDAKDEARIDAEVKALKTLDLAAASRHYLSKSILKIKAIATSPELPTELKHSRAIPNDPATLNVHARLCKSNPVREIFPALFKDVKKEFGVEDEEEAPAKKKRLRKKDFEEQEDSGLEQDGSSDQKKQSMKDHARAKVKPATVDMSGDEDSEIELAQFDNRLASSDDEDEERVADRIKQYKGLGDLLSETSKDDVGDGSMSDDEEDLDLEDLERQLEQEGIGRKSSTKAKKPYDHAADLSLSDPSSGEESEAEEVKKAPAIKKSSFIPSLTMGGYISGSGSDIDEIDVAPKKNRRGQRARQQIWEQKYGKKAKHLQNQKDDRGSGWDAKRGAVGGGRGKGTGMNKAALGRPNRLEAKSTRSSPPTKNAKAHKDDSGPLHPSWEAAKKLKEKKAVPVAFQGKKISFD